MTAGLIGSHVPWSPKDFLSTLLVSTFLMRCIRNVPSVRELTIITLMLKKSVCIVWDEWKLMNLNDANTANFDPSDVVYIF